MPDVKLIPRRFKMVNLVSLLRQYSDVCAIAAQPHSRKPKDLCGQIIDAHNAVMSPLFSSEFEHVIGWPASVSTALETLRSDVGSGLYNEGREQVKLWDLIDQIESSIPDGTDELQIEALDYPKVKAPSRNDERDTFIYEQCLKGISNKEIIAGISGHQGWARVSSDQAINRALKRHCKRLGVPIPSRRK